MVLLDFSYEFYFDLLRFVCFVLPFFHLWHLTFLNKSTFHSFFTFSRSTYFRPKRTLEPTSGSNFTFSCGTGVLYHSRVNTRSLQPSSVLLAIFRRSERSHFAQGHVKMLSFFFPSVTSFCVSTFSLSRHLLVGFIRFLYENCDRFTIYLIPNFWPPKFFRRVVSNRSSV